MPKNAADYTPERVALAKSACLYIATKLGDLMPEIRIVGGLVPSLLVPQDTLPEGAAEHLGTLDVDVGLSIGLLDEERYKTASERLRDAGFAPDVSERGNPTQQRWKMKGVTVDFLIAPSEGAEAGKLHHLEKDFAAFVAPGLPLAFRDFEKVTLEGETLFGERAKRDVWISGPGAFVALKALAFRGRGEGKDAYDLYYVVRNFGSGVEDVATRLKPLLDDENAQRAITILREDFASPNHLGPMGVPRFLMSAADAETQADVYGFIAELLRACAR